MQPTGYRSGSLPLAALLALHLVGPGNSARSEAPAEPESPVLVEIGADRFTVADLELYLRQVNPRIDLAKLPADEQERRLEEFVHKKLFALEARRAGLDQSPEVRARIDFFADRVLAQAFEDRLLAGLEVSSEELEDTYREHRERFRLPARAFLEHVLYADREKATRAREQLRDGLAFEQLAREKGRDPGVLLAERGWFTADLLIPEVAEAGFGVPAGQVSEVIRSSYGYHVVRVQERVASRIQELDAVRSEVSELVRQTKAARVFREALEETRHRHEVSVYPDRLRF